MGGEDVSLPARCRGFEVVALDAAMFGGHKKSPDMPGVENLKSVII